MLEELGCAQRRRMIFFVPGESVVLPARDSK